MRVIPYSHEYRNLILQDLDTNRDAQFALQTPEHSILNVAEGVNTFLGIHEGKVVACAGVLPIWKGVGQAFAMICPEFQNHKITVIRKLQNGIHMLQSLNNYHRIQAQVVCDNFKGKKLAAFLGFKLEGIQWQMGPNREDILMYVRLY